MTPVVLRRVSLEDGNKFIEVQEIGYDEDGEQLSGEDVQHIIAIGEVFRVLPPPSYNYEMFNILGAIRRVQDIVPPENLSATPVFTVDARGWIWPELRFIENMAVHFTGNVNQGASV